MSLFFQHEIGGTLKIMYATIFVQAVADMINFILTVVLCYSEKERLKFLLVAKQLVQLVNCFVL